MTGLLIENDELNVMCGSLNSENIRGNYENKEEGPTAGL